jgi:hypothetical protein
MRKLCTNEVGGVKMKKNGNKRILYYKNIFSLLLFYSCFFGFAFQRWFVELEKALL